MVSNLLKVCDDYFSPKELIRKSEENGGWDTVKAGLIIGSYIFVLPAVIMGALYGGAYAVKQLTPSDTSEINAIRDEHLYKSEGKKRFEKAKESVISQNFTLEADEIEGIQNMNILALTNNIGRPGDFRPERANTHLMIAKKLVELSSDSNHLAPYYSTDSGGTHLNSDGVAFLDLVNAVIDFQKSSPYVEASDWMQPFYEVQKKLNPRPKDL